MRQVHVNWNTTTELNIMSPEHRCVRCPAERSTVRRLRFRRRAFAVVATNLLFWAGCLAALAAGPADTKMAVAEDHRRVLTGAEYGALPELSRIVRGLDGVFERQKGSGGRSASAEKAEGQEGCGPGAEEEEQVHSSVATRS